MPSPLYCNPFLPLPSIAVNTDRAMDQNDKRIPAGPLTVGIISDTHGVLRPEALKALAGTQVILHAGDIGGQEVFSRLERIAPVIAVRGNMDGGDWCRDLPRTEAMELNGIGTYMLHDLYDLDLDPAAAGFRLVVSGHTHRPSAERRGDILFLNPGSATQSRGGTHAGVARIRISRGRLSHRLVDIDR
jgi:putative phosphoesterase